MPDEDFDDAAAHQLDGSPDYLPPLDLEDQP